MCLDGEVKLRYSVSYAERVEPLVPPTLSCRRGAFIYAALFFGGVAGGHTLENWGVWYPATQCSGNNPVIAHTRDGRSLHYGYGPTCGSYVTLPPGSLGVRANMYKDGVWCDATSISYNGDWLTGYYGIGKVMCAGSGGFYVRSDNWRNVDGAWYGPNYRYGLGHDF